MLANQEEMISSFRISRIVLSAALTVACTKLAKADTLIDVSGPNTAGTLTTGATVLSNNPGVGFSLAADYNNVAITVPLVSFYGGGDWNLEAYLTRKIGPGTTPIPDEVAPLSQSITLLGSDTVNPFTLNHRHDRRFGGHLVGVYNGYSRQLPAGKLL